MSTMTKNRHPIGTESVWKKKEKCKWSSMRVLNHIMFLKYIAFIKNLLSVVALTINEMLMVINESVESYNVHGYRFRLATL